jgi:hypothetical protein
MRDVGHRTAWYGTGAVWSTWGTPG